MSLFEEYQEQIQRREGLLTQLAEEQKQLDAAFKAAIRSKADTSDIAKKQMENRAAQEQIQYEIRVFKADLPHAEKQHCKGEIAALEIKLRQLTEKENQIRAEFAEVERKFKLAQDQYEAEARSVQFDGSVIGMQIQNLRKRIEQLSE